MREIHSSWRRLGFVLLLAAGCGDSDGGNSPTASPSTVAPSSVIAETDSDFYTAPEMGFATLQNLAPETLYLPGCSPFVFEQSLDGSWIFIGPLFVCVWEGFAVAVEPNESHEFSFMVPNHSGIYRLRYDYSLGCEPDLPLSVANCESESVVYSNEFEVEREFCEPTEFNCQFVPAVPIFLCADGMNLGGPAGECTRDPESGECGYEFLSCP